VKLTSCSAHPVATFGQAPRYGHLYTGPVHLLSDVIALTAVSVAAA